MILIFGGKIANKISKKKGIEYISETIPFIEKSIKKASKNGFFSIDLKFTQPWYSDPSNQQNLINEIVKQDLEVLSSNLDEEGKFLLSISWAGFSGGKQLFNPPVYTISKNMVLVLGGTGKVGNSILDSLLYHQTKYNLRATGNRKFKDGAKYSRLTNNYPGIEFLHCDYTENTVKNVIKGVNIVILVLPLSAKRIKTCKIIVEIAKLSKTLNHFILISSVRAEENKTKWGLQFSKCENLLEESGIKYTIIQLGMLQQTFYPSPDDRITVPTRNSSIPVLDVGDVGVCVEKILESLEDYENSVVALTGSTFQSGEDLAEIASTVMKREIQYESEDPQLIKEKLSQLKKFDNWTIDSLLEFYEDYAEGNYNWITDDFKRIVGRSPTSYLSSLKRTLGNQKNKSYLSLLKNSSTHQQENNEDSEEEEKLIESDSEFNINRRTKRNNTIPENKEEQIDPNEPKENPEVKIEENKPAKENTKPHQQAKPKIYTSTVDKELKLDATQSLTQFIFSHITEKDENKIALLNPSFKQMPKIPYKGFYSMVKRTAFGLKEKGFKRGDVLSIFSVSHHDYLNCFFACALLGGCCVLLPKDLDSKSLLEALESTKTSFLVCDLKHKDLISEISNQFTHLSSSNVYYFFAPLKGDLNSFWKLMNTKSDEMEFPKIDANQVILIVYPSPFSFISSEKNIGIRYSNYALLASLNQLLLTENTIDHLSVCLNLLPFDTIFSLVFSCFVLLKRGTLFIKKTVKGVDFDLLDEHSTSHIFLNAPIAQYLSSKSRESSQDDEKKETKLKYLFSAYSPLTKDCIAHFSQEHSAHLYQFLCLPDASFVTFSNEHLIQKNRASFGMLLPGISAKLINEEGKTLPENTKVPGELCIKGPNLSSSYLDKSIHNLDEDGFLKTGIISFISDHHIYYIDRKSGLLHSLRGNLRYASVVEFYLSSLEEIVDALVYERDGKLFANIIPNHPEIDLNSIQKKLFERNEKLIFESIKVVKEIPKNKSGMIIRNF